MSKVISVFVPSVRHDPMAKYMTHVQMQEDNLIQKALEHLTGSMEQLYEAMDAEKERLAEKGECDNVNEHAIVVLLRKWVWVPGRPWILTMLLCHVPVE
jgi:hypothetical protein